MKVVLSYGMGVDSSAILARWLVEPESRDFELDELVVLTSQVGDEFPDTGRLVEKHIFPLLRAHGVRFVEVAKATASESDGIAILADTTAPVDMHLDGVYKLSDELKAAGTLPTTAGTRKCSVKFKGFVLDRWLDEEFGANEYRHVMGFNADELNRVKRDKSYSTENRKSEYPLVDWGWGRVKCEEYLEELFGIRWHKSCCFYCPFAGNKKGLPEHLRRWQAHEALAAEALIMEHVALALNPRMGLYKTKTANGIVEADNDSAGCYCSYLDRLDTIETWAVYRVRRAFRAKGLADRSVEIVSTGSRAEVEAELRRLAAEAGVEAEVEDLSLRAWIKRKDDDHPKTTEELLVATPALAEAKTAKPFAKSWSNVKAIEAEREAEAARVAAEAAEAELAGCELSEK
jgi:hypothetical protein